MQHVGLYAIKSIIFYLYVHEPNPFSILLFFTEESEMVAVEGERMLRLAEQCLERAKSFIGKRAAPPEAPTSISASAASSPVQSEPQQSKTGMCKPCLPCKTSSCLFSFHPFLSPPTPSAQTLPPSDSPIDARSQETSPTKSGHRRVMSDGGVKPTSFLPPEVFQRLQTMESQDASKK